MDVIPPDSVDYPDFAHKVSSHVLENINYLGVLICGSANGVAMAANKHKGIRAAICWNKEIASLATTHNNANILCIPARFISKKEQRDMFEAFISAEFQEEDTKEELIKLIVEVKRQRLEKHESLIHQVINEYLIRYGKSFLGNEFVTIMGIKLSPDLSVALIFISVLDNTKSEFVNQKFDEKKHDIKQFLARSIGEKD